MVDRIRSYYREYRDMNAYIDEVCSINKISQNEIHLGKYLTIPYYNVVLPLQGNKIGLRIITGTRCE